MTKGGAVILLVGGPFVWWLARHTIEDALWRRDERRAAIFLAEQEVPPPPPDPLPEPCDCDLCTKKVSFQDWVEREYCLRLGLESTRQDIEELDEYWAEDWETAR